MKMCRNVSSCGCDSVINEARRWNKYAVIAPAFPVHYSNCHGRLLLQDNARPHCALNMKRFLTKHYIVEVNHHQCSTDLSPSDFYLFPKLKTTLKGHQFQDIENIGIIIKKEIALLNLTVI